MVKISDITSKVIKTSFSSLEGSELEVRSDMLGGECEQTLASVDQNQFLIKSLSKLIIKWNLQGDDGVELPITVENLRKIPIFDLKAIFDMTSFGQKAEELGQKKMK